MISVSTTSTEMTNIILGGIGSVSVHMCFFFIIEQCYSLLVHPKFFILGHIQLCDAFLAEHFVFKLEHYELVIGNKEKLNEKRDLNMNPVETLGGEYLWSMLCGCLFW